MSLCGPEITSAWANQKAWQVLDTCYAGGRQWRELLAVWRADPHRPTQLHFVGLGTDPSAKSVEFIREDITCDDGCLAHLTLISGERDAALRELRMNADLILLRDSLCPEDDAEPESAAMEFSQWTAKLLARSCHRGTQLFAPALQQASCAAMSRQGFELRASGDGSWTGQYNPRWEPKGQAHRGGSTDSTTKRCIVIGAGLAGASTAYALARRGWQVEVIDAGSKAAMGTSSLPVALMAAHQSADDSARSRLTRAGVGFTASQAERLLTRGQDWDANGVLTLRPGVAPAFNRQGAWIKPDALIKAWLAHPGVMFRGGVKVSSLAWHGLQTGGEWRVFTLDGGVVATAPLVVLAAAANCNDILSRAWVSGPDTSPMSLPLPSLLSVPGQVSWGYMEPGDDVWTPAFSVNGHGYMVAQVPMGGRSAWLAGATFEDRCNPLPEELAHSQNHSRLADLLPGAAAVLSARFAAASVNGWRGERCTTPERLPLLGPASDDAPGLWLNTGYGARGLSWSVLCAELLAAQVVGEPWPVAFSLAKVLGRRTKQPASSSVCTSG